MKIIENSLGSDNPKLALVLNNLGALQTNIGRYQEAVPLYQRALDIVRKSEGNQSPTVATILNNLAACYIEQNQYKKAEQLLVRSLQTYQTINALENYETVLRRTKRAPQANTIKEQILQLRSEQQRARG
jgi:tetratricopeptide (TPR) repeat protein